MPSSYLPYTPPSWHILESAPISIITVTHFIFKPCLALPCLKIFRGCLTSCPTAGEQTSSLAAECHAGTSPTSKHVANILTPYLQRHLDMLAARCHRSSSRVQFLFGSPSWLALSSPLVRRCCCCCCSSLCHPDASPPSTPQLSRQHH